jgi:ferredoxin
MAYKITEECIACGACVPECPAQCISEGDPILICAAAMNRNNAWREHDATWPPSWTAAGLAVTIRLAKLQHQSTLIRIAQHMLADPASAGRL